MKEFSLSSWKNLKKFLLGPYGFMMALICMYLVKFYSKVTTGTEVHSPVITADGFHNSVDILESLVVISTIFIGGMAATGRYPLGKKNAESIASLLIGIVVIGIAINFAYTSIGGLCQYLPESMSKVAGLFPTPEPLLVEPKYFWKVVLVTGGSALASVIMGPLQIYIGKSRGHSSMISDGKETCSDGVIEAVACVGVLCQHLAGLVWIEYPLGIVVALLIGKTGWGILKEGAETLIQRSLEEEIEEGIQKLSLETPGVEEIGQLKTFSVGDKAVVILKLNTRCMKNVNENIKHGLVARIVAFLKENEFTDADYYVRFGYTKSNQHRVAFAAIIHGEHVVVAPSLSVATHIVVVDSKYDKYGRATKDPVPSEGLAAFFEEKNVKTLFVFSPDGRLPVDEVKPLTAAGIEVQCVPTYELVTLGVLKAK